MKGSRDTALDGAESQFSPGEFPQPLHGPSSHAVAFPGGKVANSSCCNRPLGEKFSAVSPSSRKTELNEERHEFVVFFFFFPGSN